MANPANQPISEKLPKWHFLTHAWNLNFWAKWLHLKWLYFHFLKKIYETNVKSSTWSFGHSDPDPSSVCSLYNKAYTICVHYKEWEDSRETAVLLHLLGKWTWLLWQCGSLKEHQRTVVYGGLQIRQYKFIQSFPFLKRYLNLVFEDIVSLIDKNGLIYLT